MQAAMPQLPAEFRRQYRELGLPAADVLVLADELPTAQYFDAVLAAGSPAKPAANWIMGDIMAFCKARLPFHLLQCSPTSYTYSIQSMPWLQYPPAKVQSHFTVYELSVTVT